MLLSIQFTLHTQYRSWLSAPNQETFVCSENFISWFEDFMDVSGVQKASISKKQLSQNSTEPHTEFVHLVLAIVSLKCKGITFVFPRNIAVLNWYFLCLDNVDCRSSRTPQKPLSTCRITAEGAEWLRRVLWRKFSLPYWRVMPDSICNLTEPLHFPYWVM